jgi:hypothetical protein
MDNQSIGTVQVLMLTANPNLQTATGTNIALQSQMTETEICLTY